MSIETLAAALKQALIDSGASASWSELDAYCLREATAIWNNAPGGTLAAHASTHEPGGSDALTVDAAASVGSLRTLGTGALQAAAGNHTHASSGGWTTVLDVDFTTETPQTLSSDGDYTIGGHVWTKINSANEVAAMNISSTGLEIRPVSATDIGYSGSRTAPAIVIPVTSLGSVSWQTSIRVWMWTAYCNQNADYDGTIVGLHKPTPTGLQCEICYSHYRGHHYGIPAGFGRWGHLYADAGARNVNLPMTETYSSDVSVIEIPGVASGVQHHYAGTYSTGFPAASSLIYCGYSSYSFGAATSMVKAGLLSDWLIHIAALRYGSGTDYRPRIGRVMVEVRG